MEKDFVLLNDDHACKNAISSSNKELFLIRLPDSFDIKSLSSFKLTKDKIKEIGREVISFSSDNKHYKMMVDHPSIYRTMRPLVSNEIIGSVSVGPDFNGVLSIVEDVQYISKSANLSNDDLPIVRAYRKVEQISDLKVRALPIGSLSTMDEFHVRQIPSIEDRKKDSSTGVSNKRKTDDIGDASAVKKVRKSKDKKK